MQVRRASSRAAERDVIGPNGIYSLETVQGKENRVTHVADGKRVVLKIQWMQREPLFGSGSI